MAPSCELIEQIREWVLDLLGRSVISSGAAKRGAFALGLDAREDSWYELSPPTATLPRAPPETPSGALRPQIREQEICIRFGLTPLERYGETPCNAAPGGREARRAPGSRNAKSRYSLVLLRHVQVRKPGFRLGSVAFFGERCCGTQCIDAPRGASTRQPRGGNEHLDETSRRIHTNSRT